MKTNSNADTSIIKRGRRPGSKNKQRPLPATIHPDQMLTIADMVVLSGKSRSFFETNLSLARSGLKHTPMPPVRKLGHNVVCKASDFFIWLNGDAGKEG